MRYSTLLAAYMTAAAAAAATPALAQSSPPHRAAQTIRFERWQPELPPPSHSNATPIQVASISSPRARRAVIGGVIGAAAGMVVCTVISNIADDSEGGFSTCTAKGYLLTGAAGFAAGFLVGWVI